MSQGKLKICIVKKRSIEIHLAKNSKNELSLRAVQTLIQSSCSIAIGLKWSSFQMDFMMTRTQKQNPLCKSGNSRTISQNSLTAINKLSLIVFVPNCTSSVKYLPQTTLILAPFFFYRQWIHSSSVRIRVFHDKEIWRISVRFSDRSEVT